MLKGVLIPLLWMGLAASAAGEALRDPTRPPQLPTPAPTPDSVPALVPPRLSGIVAERGVRHAILDGRLVGVGGSVGDFKVVKIERGAVTVVANAGPVRLELLPNLNPNKNLGNKP